MVIQWLGHSSFLITSADGTKIITDPYEPGAFGGGLKYGPIKTSPDIVTVSHDHADHGYLEGVPGDFEVVSRPGAATVKGIEFKGVGSYHDPDKGAIRGLNVMFVMNVDGMRICHLGDLGHALTDDQVKELGQIDILIVPVGGYYTIDSEQAGHVIDLLNPKVVIPAHYSTAKCEFPIAPVDKFLAGQENVKRLDSSEYEINKEQLPSQREIVVLKYAL